MAITTITKSIAWAARAGLLVWSTLRTVDGSGTPIVKLLAPEYIPDPSSYAGGPKLARVQKFGTNSRQASDIKGRNEAAAMTLIVRDDDGSIRAWFEDPTLRNVLSIEASVDLRLTTDRANSIQPAPNWHGLVKQPHGIAGGTLQWDAWDLLSALEQSPLPLWPIARDFPNAPTASLAAFGQRWYGTYSDEAADAVAGAPVPVAESASGATAVGGHDFMGPLPGKVARCGFGALGGSPPVGLALTEEPQASGSPGLALGNNLNPEGGYHVLAWTVTGGVESDPFTFAPLRPGGADFLAFTGVTKQLEASCPSVGGVSTYRFALAQAALTPAAYRWEQMIESATPDVIFNQIGSANADPIDPISLSTGAVAPATTTRMAYAVSAQTSIGETALSALFVSDLSPYRRPNRGAFAPVSGTILNYWLYAAPMPSDGSAPTFTQRKLIPTTNLVSGGPNLFWEDDLLGTGFMAVSGASGGGAAQTKGRLPTIEVGGAATDLLGMTWPSRLMLAAGAVKGNLTAYSRDASSNITPLASLSGTQISIPGVGDFASRWGAAPYVTINGRRWTLIPIAGALASDVASGKVTVWLNGDGVESVGDGSGALLVSVVDQIAHLLDNDVLPLALGQNGWLGANWVAAIPAYGDGRPARNAASFAAAKAYVAAILGSDVGAWVVPQATACVDLLAQLAAVDCDCAPYPDENGAVALMPENPNPNATIRTDLPITETSEVVALSLSWQDQTTTDYHYNSLTYTFAPDVDSAGAASNPQSVPLVNAAGLAAMRGKVRTASEVLSFLARRDPAACFTIATRFANRAVPAPRDASFSTSLFALGAQGFAIGDLVPVTHSDGTGLGGWIGQLLQIRGIATNFDTYTVTLTVRQLNPTGVNDDMILTWFFGGNEAIPVSNTTYPSGSTGDKRSADTNVLAIDSAKLQGTYLFEADGYVDSGATLTIGLVNLDDAPDAPIAEVTITATTRDRAVSATTLAPGIGLAAPGVEKHYGIKTQATGGNGYCCSPRLKKAS